MWISRIRRRLPLQPSHGKFIILEITLRLLQHLAMVIIQPFLLVRREESWIDEFAAHGCHGDVLETKVGFVAEVVLGFHFADHYDVYGAC